MSRRRSWSEVSYRPGATAGHPRLTRILPELQSQPAFCLQSSPQLFRIDGSRNRLLQPAGMYKYMHKETGCRNAAQNKAGRRAGRLLGIPEETILLPCARQPARTRGRGWWQRREWEWAKYTFRIQRRNKAISSLRASWSPISGGGGRRGCARAQNPPPSCKLRSEKADFRR